MFDYFFSFLQIWGANFGGQPGFAGPAGVRWLMNRSNDVHFRTYWHTLQNLSPVCCLCWGGRGMYTWLLRDCHKRVQGKDTKLPRCHLTWHWNIPNFIGKNDEKWWNTESMEIFCQAPLPEGHPLTCQGLVAKVEAKSASGRPIRRDSPLQLVSSCLVVFCLIF